MDIFLKRINEIRDEFGLKKRMDFEKQLGMKNTSRWGKTVHSVEQDTLQLIAEKFNKSINWLLGYDEGTHHLKESETALSMGRNISVTRVESLIDIEIKRIIEEVILEEDIKLNDSQKSRLVSKCFEYFGFQRKLPDKSFIKKYLLLED